MVQTDAVSKVPRRVQIFRIWAIGKGAPYLRKGNLDEHIKCFLKEKGLSIRRCIAHDLIARIVHEWNISRRK